MSDKKKKPFSPWIPFILCWLLSILVGGLAAAANYARLGRRDKMKKAIVIAVPGFILLMIVLIILSLYLPEEAVKLIAFFITIGVGYYFFQDQRMLYQEQKAKDLSGAVENKSTNQ